MFCYYGHVGTKVGRFAIKLTGWKFWQFFVACMGVWNDELVSMYNIHGKVLAQTLAFDKTYARKKICARARDDRELGDEFIEEVGNRVPACRAEFERLKQHDYTLEALNSEELRKLDREMKDLDQSNCLDIQRIIRSDHANALYALIGPRSTFWQLVPYIGGIITIYTAETARSPIFLQSEGLEANMFEYYPRWDCFDLAREEMQQELDDMYNLRISEVHKRCNFVTTTSSSSKINSKTISSISRIEKSTTTNDTDTDDISDSYDSEIDSKQEINKKLYSATAQLLDEPKLKIPEWLVSIRGFKNFFHDSRLLCYLFYLFLFFMEVLIVYLDEKHQHTLIVVSVVCILPVCATVALDSIMTSLYVYGLDLSSILDWLILTRLNVRCSIYRFLLL